MTKYLMWCSFLALLFILLTGCARNGLGGYSDPFYNGDPGGPIIIYPAKEQTHKQDQQPLPRG